jgi:hypothetical protein
LDYFVLLAAGASREERLHLSVHHAGHLRGTLDIKPADVGR